jgi:hypothetical protein
MSDYPTDDALARAHEIFKQNHDAGRERLLGMLSEDVSQNPTIRRRSMRSVIRVLASRPLLSHWPSKLAVAVALFAALTIGLFTLQHGTVQTAYGLDDLPNRLLEVKSIYVTGWMFKPAEQENAQPARYPIKIFAERPDCYWHTCYGFSGPDATHKDVRVQSGYNVGKGTKLLSVSDDKKMAVEMTVTAIDNELLTETFMQMELPQQLLNGSPRDFTKMGTEMVNNVPCDVYEHSQDGSKEKKRLWLNPQTGLPVKIASYDIDRAGKEILSQIIDHVEVNIPASATGLSFDPPEGYQVTKSAQLQIANPLQYPVGSGSNGDVSLGVWHCFNIDDKAALLCWYCEQRKGSKAGNATIQPEFLLAGTNPCDHIDVASTDVGGHHWKWSLMYPNKAGERIGNDDFTVIHRPKGGGSLSMENHPLRLPEDRLKAILEEVQRVTHTTVQGGTEPFTLDLLRKRLDEKH